MNQYELKKNLKEKGIDTSCFDQYFDEYIKTHPKLTSVSITSRQFDGLMQCFEYFKPFFDTEEYSKLVCKKIISFSWIHALYLSTSNAHKELYVGSFAIPASPLPHIEVSCSKGGLVSLSQRKGTPPRLVSF